MRVGVLVRSVGEGRSVDEGYLVRVGVLVRSVGEGRSVDEGGSVGKECW